MKAFHFLTPLALAFSMSASAVFAAAPDRNSIALDTCERSLQKEWRIRDGKPAPNISAVQDTVAPLAQSIFDNDAEAYAYQISDDYQQSNVLMQKSSAARRALEKIAFENPCLYRNVADSLYNNLLNMPYFTPYAFRDLTQGLGKIVVYDDQGPEDLRKMMSWLLATYPDHPSTEEVLYVVEGALSEGARWMPEARTKAFRAMLEKAYKEEKNFANQSVYLGMLTNVSRESEDEIPFFLEIAKAQDKNIEQRRAAYTGLSSYMVASAKTHRKVLFDALVNLLEHPLETPEELAVDNGMNRTKNIAVNGMENIAQSWPEYREQAIQELKTDALTSSKPDLSLFALMGIYGSRPGSEAQRIELLSFYGEFIRSGKVNAMDRWPKENLKDELKRMQSEADYWLSPERRARYQGDLQALEQLSQKAGEVLQAFENAQKPAASGPVLQP